MTACIGGNETEWNALIMKLIKALSLTAHYAMCLLHKVPSTVTGTFIVTRAYVEEGRYVFQNEDHRQIFWSICTFVFMTVRESESGLIQDKKAETKENSL